MIFLTNLFNISLVIGVCCIMACALVLPASWVFAKTDSGLAATITLLASAAITGASLLTLIG